MSGTRAISTISRRKLPSFFFLLGKAPTEINAILTEILACFLPGRAKDLSAPLYKQVYRQQGELIPEYKNTPAYFKYYL